LKFTALLKADLDLEVYSHITPDHPKIYLAYTFRGDSYRLLENVKKHQMTPTNYLVSGFPELHSYGVQGNTFGRKIVTDTNITLIKIKT
jgi:hypothetical protein